MDENSQLSKAQSRSRVEVVQRGRLSRAPIRSGNEDDRPVGAKRELGTEDPGPRVEDVTEQDWMGR